METNSSLDDLHPEGEHKVAIDLKNKDSINPELTNIVCDTFKGIVHIEWDPQAPVTPLGQLPFFIDFLKTSGRYSEWVTTCPLHEKLTGPTASSPADILGTLFLSCLSGQRRYAHITSIRNDEVNPPLLNMRKIISEDTARRSFQYYNEDVDPHSELWEELRNEWQQKCELWQHSNMTYCYGPLAAEPWILDLDVTVKPLYGHQEGAEVGYNPEKPGRPSHLIHTYMMAQLRLILDCEVQPGKQNAAMYSLPRLWYLVDELPYKNKPTLIRGDCAFGNERVLSGCEIRKLNYLFKIKQTKGVKELIKFITNQYTEWVNVFDGWTATGSELKLQGWTRHRKVVIMRRLLKKEEEKTKRKDQQLLLPFMELMSDTPKYEYAVLITNLNLSLNTIVQLYRDRADSENVFDELKNQWGWGGYVTQDLLRSQIMARIVAQVYNWWSLFTRLVVSKKRKEAITSRPLLLYGVGYQTKHAGQTKITITHGHRDHKIVKEIITKINSILKWFKAAAEQLSKGEAWILLLSYIFRKFLNGRMLGSIAKLPEGYAKLWDGYQGLEYG